MQKYPFIKSDYDVLPVNECSKVRNGTQQSRLLQEINVRKVCLSSDVAQFMKSDVENLNWLQRNRHIIRMTEIEFLMLVPFANKYQTVLDRSKGKRMIVSCEIWHSMVSTGGLTKQEMQAKIDEVIQTVENAHLFLYTEKDGIVTKTKHEIL